MIRKTSRMLLSAGTALVALIGTPLAAQVTDAAPVTEEEEAAAALPETAESADAALIGGDIVVTARRRGESLQDVPISVSAFAGEALENQGAVDITALQQQTPNLTLQIARGSNSTLIAFIRGIGQQDPLWGFEPGVGLYVDDVYVARPQGAVLDIFDVERVEVLRGPQGTLYGRNTIGGAIKYVTRRLGRDMEFKVRGAYGSYHQRDLIVSGSVPLGELFAVGGAFAMYKRDGYGENLTTGAEHYDKDVLAGRISLEFTPTDSLFFRISADRTDDESNARHGHRERSFALPGLDKLPDVYDTRAGIGDENNVETQGISLTAEWEASDIITLKSITAYRDGNTQTVIDFDNGPAPYLDVPAEYSDDQFTQEFQILLQADRFQGVAGLYYLDGTAAGAFDTVTAGLNNLTVLTAGDVKTKSYAAFADLSFDITEELAISVGGRYTSDKKTGTVLRQIFVGNRSPRFGNSAAILFATRTNYTNERTFNQFTPRVSVSYEPSRDLTLYASYGRGFKSGGFDMRGDAVLVPNTGEGYDPETVDAYEVGLKGAFLDRSLFVNLAGYYSKYKGQQITLQTVVPPVPPATAIQIASQVDNVGNSRIWGIELETRAVISPELSATAAFGYTNAKFTSYAALNVLTGQIEDFSDQRGFQNTPKYNIHVAATYAKDLGSAGTLAFTPSLSFRSEYQLFEIVNPVLDQEAYELVDASLVWTSADDRFQIGAHARNLFDARYRVGGYPFGTVVASDIGFYGPPRTFTISGQVKF
jgi:iron complex outermembrane receptor protein